MSEKILVPMLGESLNEATVSKWLKNKGDSVNADEAIVELETDKVNLEVPASINGVLSEVNSNEGDGYIVSTPTGSTAYSLSCGGPIINPNSNYFLLVPIAPHTLTNRPMVISSDCNIKLEFTEENDDLIEISLDGEIISEISGGDCLIISKSKISVEFVHTSEYDYYETLRSKLFWGHDKRNA